MILDYLAAITLWLSMIAYAVLGGADFGGGFWDLFSLGAQAEEKRHFISRAIGPVWEANNVWLIYLVVGLYTAFPVVAQTLAIALLLPLSLALIGIVLRGAAFSFRAHIAYAVPVRAIWGRLFSAASIITPFLFGACAAAVASGQIHFHQGHIPVALVSAWLTPFALMVGAMAVALCATLAPIYLTVEAQHAKNEVLLSAFRKRAFIGGSCMAVFSLLGLGLAPSEAPLLWHGMIDHAIWAVIVTVLLGAATAGALFYRRYRAARVLIILETGAVLGTWGLAQLPYIIPPDLTVTNAASPPTTLWEFLVSAAVGMSLLLPSLWFLFHVFKGQNPVPRIHEKQVEEG
jgi:cytochrome bd ubiquinol oxidase subunit II